MRIAIVGCGFVADYYMTTLVNHPALTLVGAHDRDPTALARFTAFHQVPGFDSLDALLADSGAELVLNLTNPDSHYAVSRAILERDLHVYSEKPLAMDLAQAEELVSLATEKRLHLVAAPASVLGEAAQTLGAALASGSIGDVKLVYAEMEDGQVFRHDHRHWRSTSGAPWPAEDEFGVGCTLEHAGYYLTWACLFFGPVVQMTAASARLFDEKGTAQTPDELAEDFSVAVLTFASGPVMRLTCGLAAPRDRSLHIVGTEGVLSLTDGWDAQSAIYQRDTDGGWASRLPILPKIVRRLERGRPLRHWFGRRVPVPASKAIVPASSSRMDFMRGPAVMAAAISAGRAPPMDTDFALHVTELALVAQNAGRYTMPYRPRSSFKWMRPSR
ncbi:Gfo/Idh/MocA family protein [Aureimonas mangrovi]|uniref:Gfo/Idh/MocA family protein n=1 Tax=Aureimonas mangrovi TaxID=2758041 RepID=UPI00163DB55A|nr:Gfo/Idh/MocA family oxidoreductase [Aureimonas mangrovi]